MGRTRANKETVIADLKQQLSEAQLALAIDYQGLSVAEISDLRARLRPTGAVCKVTKNTLMRIAVEADETWQPMTEFLAGSNAFVLLKDDLGGAIRAYQDFKKKTKKTAFRGGVMEGRALSEQDVQAIADLPSKEELMAKVAGALNAVATKLAVSINEVPSSLARGINEVPSSLGRAVNAVAQKETDGDA